MTATGTNPVVFHFQPSFHVLLYLNIKYFKALRFKDFWHMSGDLSCATISGDRVSLQRLVHKSTS